VTNQRKRVETNKQRFPTINATQNLTILTGWAIIFLFASAFLFAEAARSQPQKPAREQTDSLLNALERKIAESKFEGVQPQLISYVKAHPDSWRGHYDLGYVQFSTHDIASSIKELSRSLELNPENAEAHKILGLDCTIIGRYDLAEVELQQAARLMPGSAEIHYFLARAYYTRGVYPLAKTEFETTIRIDPDYTKAYSNLGITLEALGDTEGARLNYLTAVQLSERRKDRSEWPYIYLSAFYNRQRKPSEALSHAREALQLNPKSDSAYFEMAKAYRTQGVLQSAVNAVRNAISINPQMPDYYYVLGLTLRKLGDEKASEEALTKYAQLTRSSGETGQQPPERSPLEPLGVPDSR